MRNITPERKDKEMQLELIEKLKERLNNGEVVLGSHITQNDAQLTEIIGNAKGIDYLWIDTEHAPIEKTTLINHLIAARASRVPAFVRIPWNDMVLAKPILDMGADGLIFPMIKTPEDTEYAVRSTMYPPYGIRGYGPRRATQFGLYNTKEYIDTNHRKLFKLVQIETKEAVDNIDRIAACEGVDVIVIGPMDLSGAFGKLAQTSDPEIRNIYRYVAEHGRRAGKNVLVSIGSYDPDTIGFWAGIGCNMITIGNESGFINDGLKATYSNFQSVISRMK